MIGAIERVVERVVFWRPGAPPVQGGMVPGVIVEPGERTLILLNRGGKAGWEFRSAVWGWTGLAGDERVTEVPVESAATDRIWGPAMRSRRCLVPFDRWHVGSPDRSQPGSGQVRSTHCIAGLWVPQDDDGVRIEFALLTCPAADDVSGLVSRMPVVMPARAWEWLETGEERALQDVEQDWMPGAPGARPFFEVCNFR